MGEIFNENSRAVETEVKRPLLKKPFFAYEPGEQRSLNYSLPVDAQKYRFGKPLSDDKTTVKDCIRFANTNPETVTELVKKQVQDFQIKGKDILGKSRTNQLFNES